MPHAYIIDDEPGIRMALRRWFERHGYVVREAADGDEAWTLLNVTNDGGAVQPDVVVCDVHLPGLSGVELLARITTSHPAITGRFILTTGDSIRYAAPNSLLAQHPLVLQKPFDLATLKALVDQVRLAP